MSIKNLKKPKIQKNDKLADLSPNLRSRRASMLHAGGFDVIFWPASSEPATEPKY